MTLPAGIPLREDAEEHFGSDLCREMISFDEAFGVRYGSILRRCAVRWGRLAMSQWSRRWEYAFAAGRIAAFAAGRGGERLRILDAGSGVTSFPHYLCERLGGAEVVCCDSNAAYGRAFGRLAEAGADPSVTFVPAGLEAMPLETGSVDGICCVSVLEHTPGRSGILEEFRRVLRPGGLLVLTFDVSLDGRAQIPVPAAGELLAAVAERFDVPADFDALGELAKADDPSRILTTDAVRQTDPSLLPWRWPVLKSTYDWLRGRGWTGGFFSLTVYCLDARATPPS